jgi:hypothetical protein
LGTSLKPFRRFSGRPVLARPQETPDRSWVASTSSRRKGRRRRAAQFPNPAIHRRSLGATVVSIPWMQPPRSKPARPEGAARGSEDAARMARRPAGLLSLTGCARLQREEAASRSAVLPVLTQNRPRHAPWTDPTRRRVASVAQRALRPQRRSGMGTRNEMLRPEAESDGAGPGPEPPSPRSARARQPSCRAACRHRPRRADANPAKSAACDRRPPGNHHAQATNAGAGVAAGCQPWLRPTVS